MEILDGLLPCVIITPIDCFWEGSLLLGPDYPVSTGGVGGIPEHLTWANLNPSQIVESLVNSEQTQDLGLQLGDIMNMSGIGTAYQEKPCLDPYDAECPDTAPNKHSKQLPDLGAMFTNGCSGFSTKYMNWPEDLLFGGVMKNKTGHISRVEAYQSVLQLMGEQELFEYYTDHRKTSGTNWNLDSAREVLEAWQRKFVNVVNNLGNSTTRDNVYAFSYTSLMDIMQDFSSISVSRVVIGYILMFIYACISLMRWSDAVRSQSGVGMAGVLLVSLSVAAGLGMCSVLGISFNASTTQDLSGEVLKRTGVTVLLTSVTNMLAFFTAAIIPIPALRAFSLQAGILVTVVVSFLVLLMVGAWGVAQVRDGLDLTDIVPRDTPEFSFLEAQTQYFGFYSIYAVSKDGFDYPNNQKLLYDYHAAFQGVDHIIKKQDGSLPTFWLIIFRQWLQVLKSQPLVYAQIPFFLTNLTTTEEIISTVKAVRSVCDDFVARGLPNYPSGVPFTFWEQYINLRFFLLLALLCVLTTTFLVLTITLMNPWLAAVLVVVLAMILVELFGFMGLVGIKLSAAPAVILIMTVGIGVEFTLHVAVWREKKKN
nr:hypothetical protein BaRGS_033929 [Batillaria attramentaria]